MGDASPFTGELSFEQIQQEIFDYLLDKCDWVYEDSIRELIKGKYTHERLNLWISTTLTSLEYDKLVIKKGEFHSLYWKIIG